MHEEREFLRESHGDTRIPIELVPIRYGIRSDIGLREHLVVCDVADGQADGGVRLIFIVADIRPETQLSGHAVDEPRVGVARIELDVQIEVGLGDEAMVLEDETARDILAGEGDAEIAGDVGGGAGRGDLLGFLAGSRRLFRAREGRGEGRQAEQGRRRDGEIMFLGH
jgi:hypothetical protein